MTFRTATNEIIQSTDGYEVRGRERDDGPTLRLRGRKAPVNKPLASAGDITDKGNDIFMSGDWGVVLQKGSPVWQAVRVAYHEAVNCYGTQGLVNLYKEKGIYNMYVKVSDGEAHDLCPQDEVEMETDGGGSGSAGGFPRQTRKS